MKRSTLGALLLLVLGAGSVFGWRYLKPLLFERGQINTSDATGEVNTFQIGGDNYLGYWFLTSPEMRKQAAKNGLAIQLEDDGGAYTERLAKLADGTYDAVVLPVSSYLQHGAAVDFPGVIVAAIAESRGADGMVGYADQLPGGGIEDLNDGELRIVYTSGSPSEFLLDLTIADFDLDELGAGDRWRQEVGDARQVYKRAKDGDGDVFVLWEPDLSRALTLPGMKYIWGSDRFAGYIVDVLVVRRDVLEKKNDALQKLLSTYYRVLRTYSNNRDKMVKEMRKSTDLKEDAVRAILDKIEWYDLEENRRLAFGIARQPGERLDEGIINTILACTDVMLASGRIDRDPLEGNPYLITNSSLIENLALTTNVAAVGGGQEVSFEALDDDDWRRLKKVGTFRVEPITFQSWNNLPSDDGKESIDRIAQLLLHNYPDYRVLILGHTGPGGDEVANVQLSLGRAQAVLQYLKAVHEVDPDRMSAQGMGSKEPPRRKPGESPRAYQYRLSRVEFLAVEANPL
jgi:ABC-type nitrate/sulfonate/bicarbonate transport system substrate-binding protein